MSRRSASLFLRFLVVGTCAFLLAAPPALAQIGGAGSIQGVVTDAAGGVIPGVTVTATNIATGVKTERQTTGADCMSSRRCRREHTPLRFGTGFHQFEQGHSRRCAQYGRSQPTVAGWCSQRDDDDYWRRHAIEYFRRPARHHDPKRVVYEFAAGDGHRRRGLWHWPGPEKSRRLHFSIAWSLGRESLGNNQWRAGIFQGCFHRRRPDH